MDLTTLVQASSAGRSKIEVSIGTRGTALLLCAVFPIACSGQPESPPPPVVSSGHGQITAARGSFCSEGGCVDKALPRTRRSLRVASGGVLQIDLSQPARRLVARRRGTAGYRYRVQRCGNEGRRWMLHLPATLDQTTLLLLEAYDDQGSATFGLRLSRRGSVHSSDADDGRVRDVCD